MLSDSYDPKPTLLYVDDEEINLSNFRNVFADDFHVLTATNGHDALKIFATHKTPIACVISDQRMPKMSGTELLARIYKKDALPCRIILTAYSDFQDISDAVNKGKIYAWVQKPWDSMTLKPLLLRASETYFISLKNKELLQSLTIKNKELEKELQLRKRAERKRQEAEIRMLAQSKLASLGEMATGIAHEINQPLTYIKILLEATERDLHHNQLDTVELIQHEIPEGLRQIERISTIIDHLRVFGRSETGNTTEPVVATQIIRASLVPIQPRLTKTHINLSVDWPSLDGISLCADPLRLEQVFVNLFSNSIDALAENKGPKKIQIAAVKQEHSVTITFFDNGCGIDEATQKKIFEPFFTTKEVNKGTGIGLSISYAIIKEHNGDLTCESKYGEGTTFNLILPLAATPKLS